MVCQGAKKQPIHCWLGCGRLMGPREPQKDWLPVWLVLVWHPELPQKDWQLAWLVLAWLPVLAWPLGLPQKDWQLAWLVLSWPLSLENPQLPCGLHLHQELT